MIKPQTEIKRKDEILNEPRVIKKTYPKFRWWDPIRLKFYYSSNALIGEANDAEKHEFIAPHVIVVDASEKKITTDDLQYISEFTGVLDSTPEMLPIFSGDIVRIPNANNDGKELTQVVQWATPYARWSISPYLMGRREIFVTGNIYQNPMPQNTVPRFETDVNILTAKKSNNIVVN